MDWRLDLYMCRKQWGLWTLDTSKPFPVLVPGQKCQYHCCALIRIIVRLAKIAPGKAKAPQYAIVLAVEVAEGRLASV